MRDCPGGESGGAAGFVRRTLRPGSRAGNAVYQRPPSAHRHTGSIPAPGSLFRPALHESSKCADLPCRPSPALMGLPLTSSTRPRAMRSSHCSRLIGAEMLAQAIEHGRPRAGRQIQSAGLMLGAEKRGSGHADARSLEKTDGHYPARSGNEPRANLRPWLIATCRIGDALAASVNSLSQRNTSTASQRPGSYKAYSRP